MLLPLVSLLLVTVSLQGLVRAVPVFGRCSATNPCDAPGVCVDNIICLPKEAPTPVFASAPFSLPVHASPLVLNLPEGLLHQNAPQTAIFLPPARINHSPPQVHPISRVFPVISRVVGEPAPDGILAAPLQDAPREPAYSFRSYPSPAKEHPMPQAAPAPLPRESHGIPQEPLHDQSECAPCSDTLQDHQPSERKSPLSFFSPSIWQSSPREYLPIARLISNDDASMNPLSFFSPSIWQSSPREYLPIARLISNDDASHQLSLPTARQISIDEVMEEELPKAKPIVASFKSYPPPPSPSPISTERAFLATAPRFPPPSSVGREYAVPEQSHLATGPRFPPPSSIGSDFAAPEQPNSYLASRLPPPAFPAGYTAPEPPIVKLADFRLRAHSVEARNPQALPGGECQPSTECTGGSECVDGICQCPGNLMHQGTVCVLRSLYPGMFAGRRKW